MRRYLLPLLGVVALAGCGGTKTVTTTVTHTVPVPPTYQSAVGPRAHPQGFGAHPAGVPLPPPLSPTASSGTLTMLDSVDTGVFSGLSPQVIAGYLPPSSWPTFAPFVTQFPHAYHVAVAVQAYAHGDHRAAISCLDVEPGDASPSQAGPWVLNEVHLGFRRPCVYSNLSEMPSVRANITSHHPSVKVYYWCADWTYYAHLDNGCDAVQWTDHYLNRNIDGSTVTTAFVAAKPPKPPAPKHDCFGKGWQHTAYCNQVRKTDAQRGARIKALNGYLAVTNHNIAVLEHELALKQARKNVEAKNLQATNAALLASLKANGCADPQRSCR